MKRLAGLLLLGTALVAACTESRDSEEVTLPLVVVEQRTPTPSFTPTEDLKSLIDRYLHLLIQAKQAGLDTSETESLNQQAVESGQAGDHQEEASYVQQAVAKLEALLAEGQEGATPAAKAGQTNPGGDRLYVGTGEYLATQDWHAILRFENAHLIDSAATGLGVTPNSTVNIQVSGDADGVMLNFVHTIFLDEARDELYVGSLFTTSDGHPCAGPREVCGSVAVFANASTMDGPQTVTRHIFGPTTQINQPHGVWVDATRDILYAANTFGRNILVWEDASSVDGDAPPDRVITYQLMGAPVYVFIDEISDRMFVAAMPGIEPLVPNINPSILIFNNASTLDGEQTPALRILGENSRLEEGNNQTTHNVWYDRQHELLFVGHHTNELLIFDMTRTNWDPTIRPTDLTTLIPRVIEINEMTDGSDKENWSLYGLFYLPSQDRLYVAVGYTTPGPHPGSPKNSIKVYDGISNPSMTGVVKPTRVIYWSNGEQYFPPQPLWVTEP